MSTAPLPPTERQQELLAAARANDERAYQALVEPHRAQLHAHCYRMLGSVHDAEDALQDALVRAWRGLPRFEGRSDLLPWLYRIATNTCLDLINRRPKRMLAFDHGPATDGHVAPGEPLVESVWVEPYPDREIGLADGYAAPEARYEQRESVELAFIAAVQHLPARQRAVLILREVLGYSALEVAGMLDTTTASVNSALQRARKTVDERLTEPSQQANLHALGDDAVRDIVDRYVDAWERTDVQAVVSMLTEDARFAMPPLRTWYEGHDGIATWLAGWPLSGAWRWRHRTTQANGQPAIGAYTWDAGERAFLPFALDVLTLDGDRIAEVTAFIVRAIGPPDREYYARWPDHALDPVQVAGVFERFGLPTRIDESAPRGGS
jgi:RNA polymerase sigma-70 factor (ECF subfamily)